MGDSIFHIVEKDDGEIEIVQLVQRFNRSNAKIKKKSQLQNTYLQSNSECKKIKKSKQKSYIKDNCTCVMCQPILQECRTKVEDENKEKLTKICVRKNYSRAKVGNDAKQKIRLEEPNATIMNKSLITHNINIEKDKEIDSSLTIKNEPEIDIMDQDETESATGKETINLQETSTFTEKGVIKQQVEKLSKRQVAVTVNSTNKQPISSIKSSTNNSLIELTTQNMKCNICGMEFSKNFNQLQTLRTHFLQHKTSTTRVIKKYTGVKCITDKLKRFEESLMKKPLILNKEVKRTEDSQSALQFKKTSTLVRDIVPKLKTSSSGIIEERKVINIKKVPLRLLRITDLVIGNTVIKNIKRTTNKSTKRDQTFAEGYVGHSETQRYNAVDLDDDIEIVEQKPELIVIDDNDDDDKPKCNSKLDEETRVRELWIS